MNRLSKSDLVAAVAAGTRQSKFTVAAVIDGLSAEIANAVLKADTKVTLTGLGTFAPRHRKARTGRNPATGEAVAIAASTTIGFKSLKRGEA